MKIIRKIFYTVTLGFASFTQIYAGNFNDAITDFSMENSLNNARVGVSIVNISTGEIEDEINGDQFFTPASIVKTITALNALDVLGTDYVYFTRVVTDGVINDDRELEGNIIIFGAGDPSLGSSNLSDSLNIVDEIKSVLKLNNVKSVKGKIITDESIFTMAHVPFPGKEEDFVWGYGAGEHGINFMGNKFTLSLDYSSGNMKVKEIKPSLLDVEVYNNVTVKSSRRQRVRGVDLRREYGSNVIVAFGEQSRARGGESFECAIPNPGKLFCDSIMNGLMLENIEVKNEDLKIGKKLTEIVTFESPRIVDILRDFLYRSDNMYAECVLRTIAINNGDELSPEMGIERSIENMKMRNLDLSQIKLKDGSGLSRLNQVTPRFMSKMLRDAEVNSNDSIKLSTLIPRIGIDGTVKRLLKDTDYEGTFALKSGSMRRVQCFAGYFPADNPKYSIAITINSFSSSRSSVIKSIEKLLKNIMDKMSADSNKITPEVCSK